MFRSKTVLIVLAMMLALAVLASACAPAAPAQKPADKPVSTTPATPATPTTPTAPSTPPPTPPTPPVTPAAPEAPVVIKTSYESATYNNDKPAFSVTYPKDWASSKVDVTGTVFYAKSGKHNLVIAVRPATDFKAAASTLFEDLIKASGTSFTPTVDAENAITCADGKTKATQILMSAAFGMAKAICTGTIKDGNAIMVVCATDPGAMDLYKEVGATLSIK